MQDIEMKTIDRKFKYRVNGLIIHNNKLLTIRMKNGTSFCLPGGHIELGENSKDAVAREMLEELNSNITIKQELAVVENFYVDKHNLQTHELSFYYIVEPETFDNIPLEDYTITENDKGEIKQHNFVWLDISSLKDKDFRPSFIKEKLINNNLTFEHLIISK